MIDWKPVLDMLDSPGPVVITTHISPDGDALGSELALAGWLEGQQGATGQDEATRRRGAARIVNSDPTPQRYAFLDPAGRLELYSPAHHDSLIRSAGTIVILDVARRDRLGGVASAIEQSTARRIIIDHHPPEANQQVAADQVVVDPTAAAVGELLFEMMEASGRPPDDAVARALYVAIMTDTGSFRYSNTTSRTHRIAARLLEHPIDTAEIFEAVYERSREARLRLLGAALSEMEVLAGGQVVLLSITQADMARTGATPEDAEGLVEFVRGMEGCRVAGVFYELKPGEAKVSLRSKGSLDVNRIARRWGGGGHRNAAGIPLQPPFPALRAAVAQALVEAVEGQPGA